MLLAWGFTVYMVIAYSYRVPVERVHYPAPDICEAAREGAVNELGPGLVSERCEEEV